MSKKTVLTVVLVGVMAAFVFVVAAQATKPKLAGDTITKTFSQGEPCITTSVALALPAQGDPFELSEQLFAALQPVPGMNSATLNVKTSTIDVGFCESSANEAMIREALVPTGLVAEAAATETETAD